MSKCHRGLGVRGVNGQGSTCHSQNHRQQKGFSFSKVSLILYILFKPEWVPSAEFNAASGIM